MNPVISVLIPVYNTESTVADCLDSVINQTYKNLEIIVVNDCTKDNAMDIVRQYASADARIKIFEHDTNQGLMMTRKTGYTNATGDYIVFVDSDDTLPPESIERKLNFIIEHDCDFVTSGITLIWPETNKKEIVIPTEQGCFDTHTILEMMLNHKLRHHLGLVIIPSELLKAHEITTYPGLTMGEDLLLLYPLITRCKKIGVIQQSLYNYIQHQGSATKSDYTLKSLSEKVIYWNTQYNIFHENGFSDDCIYRHILPELVYLYYLKFAPKAYKNLCPGLKAGLSTSNLFRYLSVKQAFTFIVLDNTNLMSRILRHLFAKFRVV